MIDIKKPVRNVLYVIIIIICVAAIFLGVYAQFFKREKDDEAGTSFLGNNTTTENTISYVEFKNNFKSLFTNDFEDRGYDDSNIKKIDASKPIVYTAIELEDESDGKYDIKVSIPIININIDGEGSNEYNSMTQRIFVEKLNDIMHNSTLYTICNISYTAYINNNILSVAIMASIKEGDSAQRIIIQAYNYNLEAKTDVKLTDILTARGLDEKIVSEKVKAVAKKSAEDAKSMQSTGYNVYERDLESEMYDISNINNFIQGPEGELYIIFAYGNTAFTSELDIIEI